MNIIFITSMNQTYFDHCGELMLQSFNNKMKNHRLVLYNEDFSGKFGKNITLQYWPMDRNYDNFQERHSNSKIKTFAKKGFSIIHALENIDADRIIWLDADCHLKSAINQQLLELISPDNVLSTHFGVKHAANDKTYFSCETGFFIVNTRHAMFKEFRKTYKNIYIKDDYKNLRRFYDGEVYGETVKLLENKGAKMLDLNPELIHKTPIPRSVLAPYITHYKAGAKDNIDFDKKLEELAQDGKKI